MGADGASALPPAPDADGRELAARPGGAVVLLVAGAAAMTAVAAGLQ